ncbi:MAG: hypothetical protein Q7V00_05235 [Sulfurimicrobium sp.]|nr:hypothetical protein [Sulfurimicrobium sp.]MDP1703537.1 hypothetical protein [Sulfurimicrobium sp.]MDP2200049.1 hypothetical protein [Sulfurimicrobium sp.]MDP3686107.1 hypothetical protein [Sulfurimicrobium sp.]MDZ7656167.1 hypothetical protein [Sulfurimicrobium sp.]
MNTLKQLEQRLICKPVDPDNAFFKNLIQALCSKDTLDLAGLYELPYEDFELAVAIMKSWRLDRYTKTKDRLRELVCLSAEQDSQSRAP